LGLGELLATIKTVCRSSRNNFKLGWASGNSSLCGFRLVRGWPAKALTFDE